MTLFCIKMLITLSHERKITFFKYTFFAFQHHFCFCFTLEVEGVPIFLRRGYIHCEIFLSKHFMKYVFYNSFHRVNCREISMIYFLRQFMKYQNSENRFSEFSLSWKTFLLNLFSCLINYFIVNDVFKNLKENVNIKVKSKHI